MRPRACFLLFSIALLAVTHAPSSLERRVEHDPFYPVLRQYDREIAALRATETVPGVAHAGARAMHGAAIVRTSAAAASARAGRIEATQANAFARQERSALSATSSAFAAYRNALARQTNDMLAAYERSIALRTQRALDARNRQLEEQASDAAFHFQQRNGADELALRLKLHYLHLGPNARASIQRRLTAIERSDAAARARLQHADGVVLAAYRLALQRQARSDVARMAASLRAQEASNLVVHQTLAASAKGTPTRASLASRAARIERGFRSAGSDLSARFSGLAGRDHTSRSATDGQIASLEAARAALYRAILERVRQGN